MNIAFVETFQAKGYAEPAGEDMSLETIGRFFLQFIGISDEEISDSDALLVGIALLMVFMAFLTLVANLFRTT